MHEYYLDMDGVLVKYDPSAYVGTEPRWLQKESHYFKNLAPDARMVQLLEKLCRLQAATKGKQDQIRVYVVTNVSNDSRLYAEHVGDKRIWLTKNCPEFDLGNFIPTISGKRDIIQAIKNNTEKLPRTAILIDDYNPNLNAWDAGGGTAVKYLNGINSPGTFSGMNISTESSVDEILEMLLSLQNNISRCLEGGGNLQC